VQNSIYFKTRPLSPLDSLWSPSSDHFSRYVFGVAPTTSPSQLFGPHISFFMQGLNSGSSCLVIMGASMYTPAPVLGPSRAANPLVYTPFWCIPVFQIICAENNNHRGANRPCGARRSAPQQWFCSSSPARVMSQTSFISPDLLGWGSGPHSVLNNYTVGD
jgi:hypothetical protein